MASITNAKLEWNESGTPVSDHFDDVYFSNVNGLEETRYVFLQSNHLPERWQTYEQRRFVIAETGFGTGLNFLAAWQAFAAFLRNNPGSVLKELHFISFEKFPVSREDLIKAHKAWPELSELSRELVEHYPIATPECHRIVLGNGAITLDLWFGDIKDCMPKVPVNEKGLVDAWFLDGFAPSKNPEMWNQQLFDNMVKLGKKDCSCATFTAAGFVRRGLIDAGFEMKKVKGFGTKRDMLAGTMTAKVAQSNFKPWFYRESNEHVKNVAIIGGGIASAALAESLTRRGLNVSLYCQDTRAAQGASGNLQGAIYPLLNGDHSGVSRVFTPAFLFARQFINQAAQRFEFNHDWCGVTQLMWCDDATTKLNKILNAGFNPELVHSLDATQTNNTVGLNVDHPSIYYPLGGWVCPAQLTEKIFEHLAKHDNFQPFFETKIEQLEWCDLEHAWSLFSRDKQYVHDTVIIANGHQFSDFSQSSDLPLGKVKGQISHIASNSELEKLNSVLCYDGYMTPVSPDNNRLCIGASYDRDNLNIHFDPIAQVENIEKLKKCIPNQTWTEHVDASDNQSRQGIRCVSRDHLPFVGNVGKLEEIKAIYSDLPKKKNQQVPNVSSHPNLYCLLGLGSRGLSTAPLMAEVLASQICQDPIPLPNDILELLHPSRMWVRKLKKGKPITEQER